MITVVGSINLDFITRVAHLPAPGETVPGDSLLLSPGGKGANQALAAARAGSEVRLLGCVGSDTFGDLALSELSGSGVDLTHVVRTPGTTGTAFIFVDAGGENSIAIIAGANAMLHPEHLTDFSMANSSTVMLQQETPVPTVEVALRFARQLGLRTLLNTAPYRQETTNLLALADIVIANETEFDLYAENLNVVGAERSDRMLAFAALIGVTLVVTLGAAGVMAATPAGLISVPGVNIVPLDTVGAGDTFCGYLAASLDLGESLEVAMRTANRAAALACLAVGAQAAIPSAAAVATYEHF